MGVRASMGSAGDAYGNAMIGSFFATIECERIDRRNFNVKAEARVALFRYVETRAARTVEASNTTCPPAASAWHAPRRRCTSLPRRTMDLDAIETGQAQVKPIARFPIILRRLITDARRNVRDSRISAELTAGESRFARRWRIFARASADGPYLVLVLVPVLGSCS